MAIEMPDSRREALRADIAGCGFDLVGFAPPRLPAEVRTQHSRWAAAGHAGRLDWLVRTIGVRADPQTHFPWLAGVIVVGLAYDRPEPRRDGLLPRISRYAQGRDYHNVIKRRLRKAMKLLRGWGATEMANYVDDGLVSEKAFAVAAGLGWQGRNTLLIHPGWGSMLFLGVLLSDLAVRPDTPMTDHCGTCRACLDACPTGAFVAPGVLDSRRCISYAGIEAPEVLGDPDAPPLNGWLHGCDDCQEVCPFVGAARRRGMAGEDAFAPWPLWAQLGPDDLLAIDTDGVDTWMAGSAVRRGGAERLRKVVSIIREEPLPRFGGGGT